MHRSGNSLTRASLQPCPQTGDAALFSQILAEVKPRSNPNDPLRLCGPNSIGRLVDHLSRSCPRRSPSQRRSKQSLPAPRRPARLVWRPSSTAHLCGASGVSRRPWNQANPSGNGEETIAGAVDLLSAEFGRANNDGPLTRRKQNGLLPSAHQQWGLALRRLVAVDPGGFRR
jgi:hypothetical protein